MKIFLTYIKMSSNHVKMSLIHLKIFSNNWRYLQIIEFMLKRRSIVYTQYPDHIKAVTHDATSLMGLVAEKFKPKDSHCQTMRLVTRDSVYIPGYMYIIIHATRVNIAQTRQTTLSLSNKHCKYVHLLKGAFARANLISVGKKVWP